MELVGSRGSFPLGFMVIIAVPSPREGAANENAGVVKHQSLSCPYFPWRGRACCSVLRAAQQRGWGSAEPQAGPLSAASAPSTLRACAGEISPVLPLDLLLMQCLELRAGEV